MLNLRPMAWLAAAFLAGLPASLPAVDYPPVLPGRPLVFPRDFGSHPQYRIEWWYVTGWVKDGAGRDYGFQVTFFRHRPGVAEDNPSAFAPRQLILAHAALSDAAGRRFLHDQRSARAGLGLADAALGDTRVWLGDWRLERAGDTYATRVAAKDFGLQFRMQAHGAPLLQGDAGYSRKGPLPVQASHYYSRPQLTVAGTLALGGDERQVTGTAWLDHEWSSQILASGTVGWDWTGINLTDGGALMAFRLHDAEGGTVWAAGSHRDPRGKLRVFKPAEVAFTPRRHWRSPRSGGDYPVSMEVAVPGFRLLLDPLLDDQELDSRRSIGTLYWEGAVRALADGKPVGQGYLELTGYWRALEL